MSEVEVMPQNIVMSAEIVPLFAQVTTTEKESVAEKLMQFESEAVQLADAMLRIQVTDQERYDKLANLTIEGKAFVKDKTAWFEPIRLLTYGLYQKVLDRRGGILKGLELQLALASSDLKSFERKQEELRQRLQREAEEKYRREEEERKLEAAAAAEAVGMSEQAVQTIIEAPVTAPTPVVAPTFNRVRGLGHRENWCAEVFDFYALVKAVAKDKKLLPLLEANLPALNAQARSLKTAMQIPGVRAVNRGV
jgi:hypothetical protein